MRRLRISKRATAPPGFGPTQIPQVGDLVRKHKVGENVVFLIRRDGAEQTVQLKTAATPGDETRPMVGISIGVDSKVKVSVNLGQDIGGPSAGTACRPVMWCFFRQWTRAW